MRFVGKFQQVTSPVTAKGIEDTALYIYNRLVSLNEVGGEPDRFGVAPDALHAWLCRAGDALAARAVGHLDARHQAQRGRARPAQRAVGAAGRVEAGDVTRGRASTGAAARSSTASRTRAATRSTCSTRRCSARGRSSR